MPFEIAYAIQAPEKILAIASSYEIHDENDNLAFVAKGKLLSLSDHITVTDGVFVWLWLVIRVAANIG